MQVLHLPSHLAQNSRKSNSDTPAIGALARQTGGEYELGADSHRQLLAFPWGFSSAVSCTLPGQPWICNAQHLCRAVTSGILKRDADS